MYESQFDNLYLGGGKTVGLTGDHAIREGKMLSYVSNIKKKTQLEYVKSLLHPESYTNVKIPSELPQETATTSLKYNGEITPNSAGRFLLIIDPAVKAAQLYNDETLNGTGTAGSPITINFDQDTSLIDMYRLVSMSIIFTYRGSLDKHSGNLVGAQTSHVGTANNNTFFSFTNIENIQNKRVVNPIDGLKLVYSPYDNQQLEYRSGTVYDNNTSDLRWKKLMIIYGEGLPPTACLRWDVVRNLEYVSKPALREYIAHTVAPSCNFDSAGLDIVKRNEVVPFRQGITGLDSMINNPVQSLFDNENKITRFGQNMIATAIDSLLGKSYK
jgi:hypothetical protein